MSKRFGRNQKRAMREALANQGKNLEFMRRQRDGAIANQRPMREALDRVARVLGPHFFGLPAVSNVVNRIEREYRVSKVQALSYVQPGDMVSLIQHAITSLECMTVSSDLDELRGAMHMRLRAPAGDVAYAISELAMTRATVEDLTREIAPMLALELRRCMPEFIQ